MRAWELNLKIPNDLLLTITCLTEQRARSIQSSKGQIWDRGEELGEAIEERSQRGKVRVRSREFQGAEKNLNNESLVYQETVHT